jgi:hypothetical protein
MKSSLSILALTCLFFSGWSQDSVLTRYNKKNYYTGWSQDSVSSKFNRKSYSLRDYIAPDIKFQSLDAGLLLQAGGGEGYGNGIGSFSLAYNRYVNTSDRQSQMAAGNTFFLNSNWDGKYVTNSTSNNLHLVNQIRKYGGDNSFWGFHTYFEYLYNGQTTNRTETSLPYSSAQRHLGNILFYFSHGNGRIEPIASARKAMDILISLDRYNKLSKSPDNAMVDSLARIANRVTYKRFFDRRFKRIYQLEELDKGIQSMGLVDNPDMIYAANLSDIWDFAYDFQRGSGQRFEYGLFPIMQFLNQSREPNPNHDPFTQPQATNETNYIYGMNVFGSWNKFTPLSYQWQSDIMLDVTASWAQSQSTRNDDLNDNYYATANFSWALGFYPTTRTYMSVIPYFLGMVDFSESVDQPFGMVSGVNFKSYFYISPRFRVNVSAGLAYSDGFLYRIPTPFWNNSNPTQSKYSTDVITNPSFQDQLVYANYSNPYFVDVRFGFFYSGIVSFSYAIF